jgi:transglutaminase-like putative cysteine protease
VSSLYIRGGAAFATLAIVAALVLTTAASSNPLAGLWTDTQQSIIDLTQGLQRYLPRGGPGTKITGVSFGPTAAITGRWTTDRGRALQIQVPTGDAARYYWRAVAYDHFDQNGWSLSDTLSVDVPAGSPILDQTSEAVLDPKARTPLTFTVTPTGYRGPNVFSPDAPTAVDAATRLSLVGDGRYLGEIDLTGGAHPYTVQALIRQVGDATPGGLTENRLRVAGADYPSLIRGLYLDVPPGTVGPDMTALLETIRKLSPLSDPYDLAKTTEQYLRSPVFTYDTDVAGLDCGQRSVVECFAHYKRGYCQHYASTMTILMRMAGIPARFVEGFLPGQRDPRTGTEVILNSNSHAWVEVYFPGYGWVPFDPTGGGVAQLGALPSGAPVASPSRTPGPSGSADSGDVRDPRRPPGGPSGSPTSPPQSGGGLAYVVVALLLGVIVAGAAFAAYRRGPRGASTPDAMFGSISGIAARFGWARRPTETVYEYTGSLAEVLPGVRPELESVALAKVEVAYAQRILGGERLRELRTAQGRIRVALLGLIFSRKRPRRR